MISGQAFHQKSNYIGLLSANTILGSAMPMLIILGGLAGLMLAPNPALATFPASIQTLAGLIATGPFSLLMGRYGRRTGFFLGGMMAVLGGLIGVAALFTQSFALLCLAHMALGAALTCYQYFRFAASEVVPVNWQPVAISLMLTSGLVAAFAGPQIFILAKDIFAPVPLAGAYAAISAVTCLGLVPLAFVRIAREGPIVQKAGVSRLKSLAILRQPQVLEAVIAGSVSQGIMVLLMAPTAVAMIGCGFSEDTAGDVIRWHVVAMFAPSFVTGFLIKRFGARLIVRLGLMLLIASALTAGSGISGWHFYGSLILLGVGWNFGFIGATSMLASAVAPQDRAVAQGANDTVIAFVATVCAFGSGAVVASFGWAWLAAVALAVLIPAALVPKKAFDLGRG